MRMKATNDGRAALAVDSNGPQSLPKEDILQCIGPSDATAERYRANGLPRTPTFRRRPSRRADWPCSVFFFRREATTRGPPFWSTRMAERAEGGGAEVMLARAAWKRTSMRETGAAVRTCAGWPTLVARWEACLPPWPVSLRPPSYFIVAWVVPPASGRCQQCSLASVIHVVARSGTMRIPQGPTWKMNLG